MIYAASADNPGTMLDVQHLMVEHIFDQEFRHLRHVQRPADHDCVVYVIVVPEDSPGSRWLQLSAGFGS
jgi:hypothetical protein